MKTWYYSIFVLALVITFTLFYFFISPFTLIPWFCFGIYGMCLRCPKCKHPTLKQGMFWVPWFPNKCEKCGYIYK
jgi:hypothetical protein